MVNVSSLSNPTLVYSISYGSYEVGLTSNEISAFNYEAMKLGARGVTIVAASGDDGIAGFLFRDGTISTSKCGYYATWPASCPYVTSIGGTMGGMETTGSRSQEIVCSVSSGSGITSGGGFSNSIPAPDFQISAINNYINKYKPKQSNYQRYNTKNRGFPDLAMPANLYIVSIGQKFYGIDGTSASAPVFAGLVSLVNAIKLRQGQSPLGWLNPTIYRNNGEFTNDITSGNNDCTASAQHCCSFGFQATSGWDPITGFGSFYITFIVILVHPDSIETKFLPKDDLLAPSPSELRILSELPEEEYNRKVLIEPRMVRSSQQGVRTAHQWQITWLPTARWSNPLMGWTSTSDTMANVKLYFDNRDEAIAFAERNAWSYEVKGPTTLTIVQPGTNKYSDNFLPRSTIHKLKQEGIKNKIFASPGYGNSNFFMPLNYHGTNPVEQFGPRVKK
eukprot:gene16797-22278_t